jgi:hypothetical protein
MTIQDGGSSVPAFSLRLTALYDCGDAPSAFTVRAEGLRRHTRTGDNAMSDDEKPEQIPLNQILSEEGAHELASSPEMKPYLDLIMAEMQGHDTAPQLKAITELPLVKRYVWRVASALKWGFADFEDMNVVADKNTLTDEDFARVRELLNVRPIQFCMFLKALFGTEEMERLMIHAITVAKQIGEG